MTRITSFASGGHSAIEAYDPGSRKWSYFDPYFDILLPNASAQELAANKESASNIPAVYVERPQHQDLFGKWVTLGQLFKYRVYGDHLNRLSNISMLRLAAGAGEAAYGRTWSLNHAEPRPAQEQPGVTQEPRPARRF